MARPASNWLPVLTSAILTPPWTSSSPCRTRWPSGAAGGRRGSGTVFQSQPEFAHVSLGSRQHLLRRVFTDANQPLYNSAKVMALGPIVPEVFAAFIKERYSASGKTITPEATTALWG